MLNFLDLLVIVFMVLAASSLLAVCLMFLVRNPKIKKGSFYVVVALGIYAASIGIRIGGSLFPMQMAVGVAAGAASIAALVLERMSRGNEKKRKLAYILAAAALAVGFMNAIM